MAEKFSLADEQQKRSAIIPPGSWIEAVVSLQRGRGAMIYSA
jgi:hypothetical protein